MPSSTRKDLSLAVLIAALVAAGGLLPLAYHYGEDQRAAHPDSTVASAPVTAAPPVASTPGAPPAVPPGSAALPAPSTPPASPGALGAGPAPATEAAAGVEPAAPGAELVPAEESETDRGTASATPSGPTLSTARASGLHLTPDPMHLNSSVALVADADTGEVYVRKNEQAVLPIASLTKLMSTLLVVEAKQPMDEVLTITEEDVDNERHSRSRLKVGTQLTREEALHLALMSSENRAAHALGRAYPGGLPKMVEAMNAKARALGMKNTTYVDPTGLSNRNQSTAQDIALLVRNAAQNPVLRDFSTTPALAADLGGRTLQYRNSNRLIRNDVGGWDISLQKTGYIVEAGRCLTMVTKVGGHNLVMVLLDADTNGARVADANRLRQLVVAKNGWQDEAAAMAKAQAEERRALARADDDRARKFASAKGARSGARKPAGKNRDVAVARKAGKGKDVVAARTGKDTAAAKGKSAARVAVARRSEGKAGKKEGRVKQTFAAARSREKS